MEFAACGGEHGLHGALAVVKVPLNGTDRHVLSLLGQHLGFLHGRHALMREEHHNPRPVHIVEALQRGFASIARGCRQDHGRLLHPGDAARRGHQLRQHAQRHVLEGCGWPVKEFQYVIVTDGDQRSELVAGKPPFIGAAHQPAHVVKARQQAAEDLLGLLQGLKLQAAFHVKSASGCEIRVHIQPAVRGEALQHCFRRGYKPAPARRAEESGAAGSLSRHSPGARRSMRRGRMLCRSIRFHGLGIAAGHLDFDLIQNTHN